MAAVQLREIRRVTADGTVALDGVSVAVADGESLGVIGPSGAGKSMLLRAIAGLVPLTSGQVVIGDHDVTKLQPRDRRLLMARDPEQLKAALSVVERVLLPSDLHRVRPGPRRRGRMPLELIAENLGGPPAALLLDDPLRRLDPPSQRTGLAELHSTLRMAEVTVVHATNSHRDVLAYCDRVAVLRAGRVVQVAPPAELVLRPASAFVAAFVGDAALVDAAVVDDAGLGWLRVGDQRLRFPGGLPGPVRERAGQTLRWGVSPAMARVATPEDPVDLRLRGRVDVVSRTGSADYVTVDAGAVRVVATADPGQAPKRGGEVEVTIDVRRMAAFDPVTGVAVWHGAAEGG